MKFTLFLILWISAAFAHEKETKTRADLLATASFTTQRHHPWPFALLSIGHNMQSYQDYNGSPYWHDGLDIRARQDQPIQAAVGGRVVNIENYVRGNPLYWEIAILDDEGFIWKYHHVERRSIPSEIQSALKSGKKIPEGAYLGNVVRWPITTYGELYHHLHLLVVAKDQMYINPFLMMLPLADTSSPIIHKIGISKNHEVLGGNSVKGPHGLYVQASDLVLHDKFLLPPHKISYRLDGGEERLVWEFTNLPGGGSDTKFIEDFYLNGTCGNYSCRKLLINLNFTPDNPRQLLSLPSGAHRVDVTLEDIVGNSVSGSFQWTVL
jgi:hypothetical protein